MELLNRIVHKEITDDTDVRICIGQRGWIWVGVFRMERLNANYRQVVIENSYAIRAWGTDEGLGQLIDGPRPGTVLDPCQTVIMHEVGLVATYRANPAAWRDKLLEEHSIYDLEES